MGSSSPVRIQASIEAAISEEFDALLNKNKDNKLLQFLITKAGTPGPVREIDVKELVGTVVLF